MSDVMTLQADEESQGCRLRDVISISPWTLWWIQYLYLGETVERGA